MTTRASVRHLAAAAVHVRIQLRRPFATATGTWATRDAWIVRLRDADGRAGFGEVPLEPAARPREVDLVATEVRKTIEAIATGTAPELLLAAEALPAAIRAGLEAALIGCGRAPVPGGMASYGVAVPVNATIDGGAIDDVVAAAEAAVAAGFASLKLKGGRESSIEALVQRITAVRAAVGADVGLRLDVNGAWDMTTARAALRALEPLDLEYVEQPLASDGSELHALADLRRSFGGRIAVDESIVDVAGARAVVEAAAADVLVLKPARLGGIRAAHAIGDLAAAAGVRVVVSNLLETGVGIAAGLALAASLDRHSVDGRRLAHGLATAELLTTDLLADPLLVSGGHLVSRDLAGLRLDNRAVQAHAVDGIGERW
ncbi:MAG: enolase C-terminal domain-like protein [Chloroflexota bacterium]